MFGCSVAKEETLSGPLARMNPEVVLGSRLSYNHSLMLSSEYDHIMAWNGGTILPNLNAIWGMSAQKLCRD